MSSGEESKESRVWHLVNQQETSDQTDSYLFSWSFFPPFFDSQAISSYKNVNAGLNMKGNFFLPQLCQTYLPNN